MEKCPFCKTAISEHLGRFGGPCPQCFQEIPGEEAATNPGVQAPDSAPAPPPKRSQKSLFILLTVLLTTGGGFLVWQSGNASQEVAITEGEEEDFYMVPISEIPAETKAEGGAADPKEEAVAQAPTPTGEGAAQPPPEEYAVPDRLKPVANSNTPQIQEEPVRSTLGPNLSGGVGDPAVMPSFGGAVLSDPLLIETMVKDVIARYKGQMKYCYDQQLKAKDGLRGTWYLAFTIQSSGAVAGVSAVGKDQADAELEACMVRSASKWKFQAITEPQYIKYPFRFGV